MRLNPFIDFALFPIALIYLAGLLFVSPTNSSAEKARLKPKALDGESLVACELWLKENTRNPADYVVSKFADHDLVLLGEIHEIKENCVFVASLIDSLYHAGVRTLCSEFICSRYNDRLAEILTTAEYEEAGVVELFRCGPWPTWGYREYMDIVEAAWAFNRTLPVDAQPFRIVGIDSDWKQVDLLSKGRMQSFMMVRSREWHMAATIEREVFAKQEKALVHIGLAHTARQHERLAAILAPEHGDRMFQVCLHHEMPGGEHSRRFTEFIEQVIANVGQRPIGFDVVGTPFGNLRGEKAMYFRMLGKNSLFQDFAEGYVLLKPAPELTAVTWVEGFITEETFADAKTVAEKLRWVEADQYTTPEELDRALAARLAKR